MHQSEINNWIRVADQFEATGQIETRFYKRARAIALGAPYPLQAFAVEDDGDIKGS
jgi:hypothetical protein